MAKVIMDAILCVFIIGYGLYAYKKDIKASEKLKRIEDREKRLRGMYEQPVCYYHRVDLDNHKVTVGGRWIIGVYVQDACFKEFPYNPNDAEDKTFAIREAEELIDTLKEK